MELGLTNLSQYNNHTRKEGRRQTRFLSDGYRCDLPSFLLLRRRQRRPQFECTSELSSGAPFVCERGEEGANGDRGADVSFMLSLKLLVDSTAAGSACLPSADRPSFLPSLIC